MLGGISIVGCARFLRLHWKSGDTRDAADSGALQQRFRRVNLHESIKRSSQNGAEAETDAVILPTLTGQDRKTNAAIFSFMAGVTPPMPVLRRSFVGPEAYSGPLSTLIARSLPRHSMWRRIRKRSSGPFPRRRVKRPDDPLDGQRKVPRASRLKSSNTFNSRNCRPSASRSAMKSSDQTRFGASGTASSSGFSRFSRRRGVRHGHSDQWRSMAHSRHFFPSVSRIRSACMLRSANMRFSHRFSSSRAVRGSLGPVAFTAHSGSPWTHPCRHTWPAICKTSRC